MTSSGIGDADIDGIGRILDSLIDDRRHDARIHAEQVFARHARLAGDTRGDDHHIGIGSRSIVVRARNAYRELLDRTHVHHIERLALWQTFGHIDQDHIGEILACDDMCCSRADVTCTNDGYLTHDSLLESFNRFIILYCKGEQPRKEALYGRIRISARIPMFI